jgi:hypothetical protein
MTTVSPLAETHTVQNVRYTKCAVNITGITNNPMSSPHTVHFAKPWLLAIQAGMKSGAARVTGGKDAASYALS